MSCHDCKGCIAKICRDPESFRNGRPVLKGMTCSKFESEKEQEAA